MTTTFDVGEMAHALAELTSHRHLHKLAFVLPLAPGMRDFVHGLLSEGPPFNLRRAGIDEHEVLLTDVEAIFMFSLPEGPRTLERILEEEDFWTVVASWERVAAGRPRLAEVAFDWHSGSGEP